MKDSELRQYTTEWLQYGRAQPMWDKSMNSLYSNVFVNSPIHNDDIASEFKKEFLLFLENHTMSRLTGTDTFPYSDVCIGCTQFIDDIYQRLGNNRVMIFENDYKYHWRLNNNIEYVTLDTLTPGKELIISVPFPAIGDIHPEMNNILNKCVELEIPVHIDGAWISCSRDIGFDFAHPAISSFAVSLSKAGLGTDRIGVRYSRSRSPGAITIMNDFNMTGKGAMHLGMEFMRQLGPEYFWKKYETKYYQVCADFDLVPTKAIHLARTHDGQLVGVRSLLRCQTNLPNPHNLS